MKRVIRFFSSSIRIRILSIFSIAGILILALVIAGYYQLHQVQIASDQFEPHNRQIGLLQDIALSVSSVDANLDRFFVIGGAEFKEGIIQDLDNISVAVQSIKEQSDAEIAAPLEELEEVSENLHLDIFPLLETSSTELTSREVNARIISVYSQIDTLKQLHQSLSTITQNHMRSLIVSQNSLITSVLKHIFLIGILMISVILAAAMVTTRILRPIRSLTETITAVASGDLKRTVPVKSHDEIGVLAHAFNQMTAQLSDSIGHLEQRVNERTRALKISLEISRKFSGILNREQLLSTVVEEISATFDYYYTHVYLFDQARQNLALVAGTGAYGQATIAREHKIPRGKGLVGRAADTNSIVLVPDVTLDKEWIPHPLLPDIKAEVEVPIKAGGRVLGVLGVQHNVLNVLNQEGADLLQSIANQVAVALENARLYEQAQQEIKERQRVELALEAHAHKLESSNRELEEFVFIASHDLQEPLRKVQAFGSRLQGKYGNALDDRGSDFLARMLNATERMQALINSLLAYSRVLQKAQPFKPVDLVQVARDVVSDLEMRIEEAGGQVELGRLPTIDADPIQMRQLFQNLIGNALKFQKPGGPPLVKVDCRPLNGQHNNETQPESENGFYEISISDNGIGFDEKYADRIFGVFQRLHGQDSYEGAGIGLAICKKIVERHNGRITTLSVPDEGATFVVTLPATQINGEIEI